MGAADAGTEPIRRTGYCGRDHQGGRCRSAHRALPGRHGDAEPHGAELAECLGATSGEAPRQEARNHCAGPAYRRGASPDVAGWHRVPVHTRRRDGASDSIGAAASHRQSARRKEPRLKVGDPPVSPRRDAVPDDARNRPCLPNRLIAFEHAAQIGTRESFWTRHEVCFLGFFAMPRQGGWAGDLGAGAAEHRGEEPDCYRVVQSGDRTHARREPAGLRRAWPLSERFTQVVEILTCDLEHHRREQQQPDEVGHRHQPVESVRQVPD